MKRKLSPWCKEVKKTLIDRDMTVTDLCDQVGMCRNYVSRTINGASYAPALAETISKASCRVIMLMIDSTTVAIVCRAVPNFLNGIGCDVFVFFHGIK